jgi:dolichol-phosphate mannosyltransferase
MENSNSNLSTTSGSRLEDEQINLPRLSIVVPVYNEEANIASLLSRIDAAVAKTAGSSEIIIVDDGSRDGTWWAICEAAAANPQIRGYRLSRNFGHQHALLAGLRQARGKAVVSLDGDLQHPPEAIPDLVAQWDDGFEIVNTCRIEESQVNRPFKRLTSKYFYRLFSRLAEVDLSEGTSDFRLIDRRALDALISFQDSEIFLRGAVQWLGFKTTTVPFRLAPRNAGTSKYNLRRMIRFAVTGMISYSSKPLRLGIWLGLITAGLAFVELIYILIQYTLGDTVQGWASTLGVISLLFGVLFVLLGIIGVYLADIHKMLRSRPRFIIAEETPQKVEETTQK